MGLVYRKAKKKSQKFSPFEKETVENIPSVSLLLKISCHLGKYSDTKLFAVIENGGKLFQVYPYLSNNLTSLL